MIDPTDITNYNLSTEELEEHILFWVCAAGKNGRTAARTLEVFLNMITWNGMTPFQAIRNKCSDDNMPDDIIEENFSDYKNMTDLMKMAGIGCYNHKSRSFSELAYSKLDLKSCTPDDLEQIYGIGMKTSRCFLLHSRENARCAGLDTHMLKFLRAKGVKDVPKSTPTSRKQYLRLEKEVLKFADKEKMTPADFDLKVWNKYSVKSKKRGK
jgi:hypothetical protein